MNGDLEVRGNPTAAGTGGAIHANGSVHLSGNPCAQTYFSAVDNIPSASNAEGGSGCSSAQVDVRPYSEPLNIPTLLPSQYKDLADYWLAINGDIYRRTATGWDMTPIALSGWSFRNHDKEWRGGSAIPQGTYYVDGNVTITGSRGSTAFPLPLTILVEGYYNVSGNPKTTPKLTVPFRGGIAVIAGTDIELTGGGSDTFQGLHYARHQIDVSGSPSLVGQLVAANVADTWYPEPANSHYSHNNIVPLDHTGRMAITGNPTVTYNGGGLFGARAISWRECRGNDAAQPCGAP